MSAQKRFWKQASTVEAEGGFSVALDGKPIRTPGKLPFAVPTQPLADTIAAEWDAQGERLDVDALPMTRLSYSALEGIPPHREKFVMEIAAYGGSDLLCYRAAHPDGLIARQAERWDPMIDWARDRYDAPLILTQGVMPVAQPAPSLDRMAQAVEGHDDFELTALFDLVSISGSLVLGLAVSDGRLDAEEAFSLSRLDEDWQIEQWGEDNEAAAAAERKRQSFTVAARYLGLVRTP